MCGIAGFFCNSMSLDVSELTSTIGRMTNFIAHRGPDDAGTWIDEKRCVVLGHRRLSILDLSSSGHQPMISASGRYVLVFNGEIYNYRDLRKELDCGLAMSYSAGQMGARIWHGHSDTEVMLAAFEQWGVEEALCRFNGMFAFALWDCRERMLHLARDRFGEKPLYYGWMGNTFLFASELKALKAHPAWKGEIDRGALALYMRHTYIPAPYSIYRGVRKLPPAHVLSIPISAEPCDVPEARAYWSAKAWAEEGIRNPFVAGESDLIGELGLLLRNAVMVRMEADVPLGAFLSGGIDSSAVVALMQEQSSRPVKTFTIGFHEDGYNEAIRAKEVARYLGTEHTELYVSVREAVSVISQLPFIYDEPFADSSQIPTYLISKLTRGQVTVALSGDGGDELLGGYNRYSWGQLIWRWLKLVPHPVRVVMMNQLAKLTHQQWGKLFAGVDPIWPNRLKVTLPGDKIHKLLKVLDSRTPEMMYRELVTFWSPQSVVLGAIEPTTALTDDSQQAKIQDLIRRMMFMDIVTYLPDDILTKVDRASMAVSLEARVPFLDHRIYEFVCKLPTDMNVRNGQGKWPLRQILYKYVPKSLVDRPKMGFGVPISAWLRGPLRNWAEGLLDNSHMEQQGFLDSYVVRKKWKEHISGTHNWSSQLWTILMFQAWLDAQYGEL